MTYKDMDTETLGTGKIYSGAGIESRGVDTLFATADTNTEEAFAIHGMDRCEIATFWRKPHNQW